MKLYTLTVIDLRFETNDTVTVFFKQPGLKPVKYLAGQYLSLIFRINNRRYIRPYSFSSAPGVDKTLNITVKRIPGGIVSNHIIDKLKINDTVQVMEPMGNFILNNEYNIDMVYLWGAGSGITPLISIAKYALNNKKVANVKLVYGNRDYENIIFKSEIEDMEKRFFDIFSSHHFITKPFIEKHYPNIVQGRITSNEVKRIIEDYKSLLGNSFHYICGPIGLKNSVKTVLKEYGVADNNIFSEDFEVSYNPEDFVNIYTQFVSINQNGNTKKIEVIAGKSILDAGLDALMDLNYSCQTGNCLVCRGRLLKGEIKMIGINKLPDELMDNECLLCRSFPVSDDVQITIE